jgi:hypothetical protein
VSILPDQPELITTDLDTVSGDCIDDCCVPAEYLPVVSRAELRARAMAAPSSFLAFLLGVTPEAGAR